DTPLSGTLGALGVTFIPAANLAIDDLNTKYTNQNFSLVVQDTQSSDVATALAATALVNAGVLGVAGAARSAGTIAAEAVTDGGAEAPAASPSEDSSGPEAVEEPTYTECRQCGCILSSEHSVSGFCSDGCKERHSAAAD
ncbi:hypothetical protein LCGC14_0753080, partial [marine sediment metagenome]